MITKGQDEFIARFKAKYDTANLPHSLILVGDKGSEQEALLQCLASYYHLQLFTAGAMQGSDYDIFTLVTVPSMFVIDLSQVNFDAQNKLLKTFEEPGDYAYIVLLCENLNNVLETVANRGVIEHLDKYSREQLEVDIVDKESANLILELCTTPGQIADANHTNMPELVKLCDTIIDKMEKANIVNALTITNKIDINKEYTGGYYLDIFLKTLAREMVKQNKFDLYKIVRKAQIYSDFMNIDKKSYIDEIIIELWKEVRK